MAEPIHDPRESRELVQQIINETSSAQCRVLMHSWEPVTVTKEGRWFTQELLCRRCSTQKFVEISITGTTGRSRYRYHDYKPDGARPITPDDRDALRLAVLVTPFLKKK